MKDKLLKTFTDEDLSDDSEYSPNDSRYEFSRRDPQEHWKQASLNNSLTH